MIAREPATETPLEAARRHLARGRQPIPIAPAEKKPLGGDGWQHQRFTEADLPAHFPPNGNVGLLLGAPSGGLVDVDLDCPEAIAVAPSYLPETGMRHGRASTPEAHRWYTTDAPETVKQYRDPSDRKMLAELRSGSDAKGVQTVIPPSVHPSGERLTWSADGEPARVEIANLQARVSVVAAAALLARHFPAQGSRHEFALALAGALLRDPDTDEDQTYRFIEAVCRAGGSTDPGARAASARTTAKRMAEGENVTGFPRLAEIVGEKVARKACEWLALRRSDGATVKPRVGASPEVLKRLETGSDYEVATRVLGAATGAGPALVHDRGQFYQYAPEKGLWQIVEPYRLEREAHKLDGWIVVADCTDKKPGIYKAHNSRVKGAVARAASVVASPGFFDAPSGIAFSNGFLSLRTVAELLPHSPDHRATVGLPFAFDPTGSAPLFCAALTAWFRDDDDAQQKIDLLQEFVGACVIGIATRYQVCLVLVGEGANGKSVFISVVRGLFPAGAVTSIPPQDFGQEYRRALLAGSRLNAVSELPEAEILESESFKAIVAGDEITGRHIREAPFNFRPVAGHLFAANRLPGTVDQTHGFWRRFMPLRFNRIFALPEQDPDLGDKIVAAELPAIAAWAVEGARRLLARGRFAPPASVERERQEWRRRADQVRQFAEDMLTVVDNPIATGGETLYREYRHYASDNGYAPLNNNKLAERLEGLGLAIRRTRRKDSRGWNVTVKGGGFPTVVWPTPTPPRRPE